MQYEVERKYRIRGYNPELLEAAGKKEHIRQGYFPLTPPNTARVRITRPEGSVIETADITFKKPLEGGSMGARGELPIVCTLEEAEALLQEFCYGIVEKTRYSVHFKGILWEVDVFRGRHAGLVLAEVEFLEDFAHQALMRDMLLPQLAAESFPPYLWGFTDVSEDVRYTNAAIAKPDWRKPSKYRGEDHAENI